MAIGSRSIGAAPVLAPSATALRHPDGYQFTAIPCVATLLQVLDGSARRPGLWMQAHLAEPTRLLRDMQCMGVEIVETWSEWNDETH